MSGYVTKKKYLDFRLFKALITVCLLSLEFCDLDRFFQKNEKLSNSLFLGFYIFWGFDTFVSTRCLLQN